MGMGAPEPIYYTAEMVRALNAAVPEHTPRYETVHGELFVTRNAPHPRHQRVVGRLFRIVADYLDRERVGEAFMSPSSLSFGLDDVLVMPDVFVVPPGASSAFDAGEDWDVVDGLLLVAEVLGPSTTRTDRFAKRRLYQERGVPLYWIVDLDARAVEVWTPDDTFPRFERAQLLWRPAGATTPLVIDRPSLLVDA